MKKLRQLPIFTIRDTSFLVDIAQQMLRQADNPSNEISFISDMLDKGDHYLLNYDFIGKKRSGSDTDPAMSIEVRVPPLVKLDPRGMAARYGMTAEQLKGKTDFEVIVDRKLLALRHKGVLPQIDIAGEPFIVDLRLQELRHAQNFHPVISLKSFDLSDDGWHYTAFYHPVMKQVVTVDPELTEFPGGVVKIELPNEIGLDPVGTARQYGMDERGLLRRHPIQRELKAAIVPLSETGIPALIQRNREELQRQHQEIVRRIKPKQKVRF
jgi:hypothetical protein